MQVINILILVLLVFFCSGFSQTIKFAPLPIKPKEELIGEYIPLVEYLTEKTGLNIQLVYIDSYQKIVEEFKKGNVQITVLGPLPYVKLLMEYSDAQAILHIKEKDGSSFCRCVIITLPNGPKRYLKITKDGTNSLES